MGHIKCYTVKEEPFQLNKEATLQNTLYNCASISCLAKFSSLTARVQFFAANNISEKFFSSQKTSSTQCSSSSTEKVARVNVSCHFILFIKIKWKT